MTYEMYRFVFLGAAIACGVFFVVSAVLFFTLRIPKVISDLTGRTARKAIENIRLQNEQSGDKSYQSSAVNLERGKLTDKISKSGKLIPRENTPFGTGVITEKISTQELAPAGETDVLMVTEETTLLDSGETTLLDGGETTLLSSSAETTLLSATSGQTGRLNTAGSFAIEYEITYIHTDEVIA